MSENIGANRVPLTEEKAKILVGAMVRITEKDKHVYIPKPEKDSGYKDHIMLTSDDAEDLAADCTEVWIKSWIMLNKEDLKKEEYDAVYNCKDDDKLGKLGSLTSALQKARDQYRNQRGELISGAKNIITEALVSTKKSLGFAGLSATFYVRNGGDSMIISFKRDEYDEWASWEEVGVESVETAEELSNLYLYLNDASHLLGWHGVRIEV